MSIRQKDATCTSQTLINSSKSVLNERTNFDLLFKLIKDNNIFDTIKSFLNSNVTLQFGFCDFTLLHCAALYNSDCNIINGLLDFGSDINATDKLVGATSLLHAAAMNSLSIVRTLFDHGSDLNARDNNGADILSYAAVNWEYGSQIISFCAQQGAYVHGWDNEGAMPLAYAVRARAPLSTVKALVRTGVDPLTADINGVTPVLWAAANGDEDTIAYLREHGAGPDEKQKAAVKRRLRKAKEGIHFQ